MKLSLLIKRYNDEMSMPPLRQPKIVNTIQKIEEKYVILTLKDGVKLVVSSDSFNGIIPVVDGLKCVLCCTKLDIKYKENHNVLDSHKRSLNRCPHQEEFGANLIRVLNKDMCFCTICNATTSAHRLMYHITLDSHLEELDKAFLRASAYHPLDINNNK